MADWNLPVNSTLYTNVLANLRDRDFDAGSLFLNAPTNPITGMIRYNRSTNLFEEYNGSSWVAKTLALAGGGTGATDAAGARTALGLGTLATQASNSVAITGGSISGLLSLGVSGTVTAGLFSGSGASLTNIPNAAVGATALNTPSAIVARDASGNFIANQITANLVGNVSGTVTNGVVTTGSYSNPAWITALSASKLTSGIVPDSVIDSNYLKRVGGVMTNTLQPFGKVYRDSNQTIANNFWQELYLNTTYFDPYGLLSSGSPQIRLSAGGDGIYLIIVQVTFLASANGVRKLVITTSLDDTGAIARAEAPGHATIPVVLTCMAVWRAIQGSTSTAFYPYVYQDSGGNLDVYGSGQSNTSVTVVKLW